MIMALILIAATVLTINGCTTMKEVKKTDINSFMNPILKDGADPYIVRNGDFYYYCYSDGDRSIFIKKTDDFTKLSEAEETRVWRSPMAKPYTYETWAPELHNINGKWYIYFAADNGNNINHRMYVLESVTSDPLGEYIYKGAIAESYNRWGIDGTPLILDDGQMFYIWSGWEEDKNDAQHIYMAKMINPWTTIGDRVILSSPKYDWEIPEDGPKVNEGPQVLKLANKIHIVYSANGSWTDDYCYGMLTYAGGDPLNKDSWNKSESPVFEKGNGVYGTGHGSFTISPDGSENWMIYHAAKFSGAGWNREVRAQQFTYNDQGIPNFGEPISNKIKILRPAK